MPIDPSIALQGIAPKFNNPFEVLAHYQAQRDESALRQQQIRSGQAAEEARRQDIEKQRRDEAAQQAFFNIISTSKTPDEVETRIKTEAPGLLAGYQKQRMELDDKAADIKKKQLDAAKAKAEIDKAGQEYSAPFMQLVEKSGYKPEVFDFALNTISSHFEGFPADQLRQQAAGDPAKIKQLIDGFKSTAQQNADTTASTAAAELPGKTAQSTILSAQAAGMHGGLTPDQQRQQAQAATVDAREQQRLKLEAQRVTQEGQRIARAPDARTDKSYQTANASLENLRKPIADQSERLARLADSVNQSTPQADALIAPELLTVMAGGAGSGLRMNEAEISRIIGGRSNLEGLKAALNKWQIDPSKALSITPAQRDQIRKLMTSVQSRATAKLDAIYDASQQLIDAGDVDTHRRIVSDTRRKIDTINTGASGARKVTMKAPNGQTREVDESEVDHYKSLGATVVK